MSMVVISKRRYQKMNALHEAAYALYDLAAGLPCERPILLAGAAEIEAMANGEQAMLGAVASLRKLAANIHADLDPAEKKRAALLAAYIRRIAEEGQAAWPARIYASREGSIAHRPPELR